MNVIVAQKQVEKSDIGNALLGAVSAINEEFEEHLQAINENTQEITENYAFMFELDNKINKLNEKIDEIYSVLSSMTGKRLNKVAAFEDIDPLSAVEKSVFLNIYTESEPISFADLALKLNMSVAVSREHVQRLIEKGVPINKVYRHTRPFVLLDKKFRCLQAKKNVLKIEQKILV